MPNSSRSRSRNRSDPNNQSKPQQDNSQEAKLYINGLQANVDETELRKLFDKYGNIKDVFIRRKEDFSFAFISYSSIEEANRAIEAMSKGQRLNGKQLRVALVKPKKPKNYDQTGKQQPRSRTCFTCKQSGHFAKQCQKANQPEHSIARHQNSYNPEYHRKQTSRNGSKVYRKPLSSSSQSRSKSPERHHHRRRRYSRSSSRSASPKRVYRHSRRRSVSSQSDSPPRRNSTRRSRRRQRSPSARERRSRSRSGDRRNHFYRKRRASRSKSYS